VSDIPSDDDWVTKRQVLAHFGINSMTLAAWVREKRIPVIRWPWGFRYRIADIEPVFRETEKDKVRRVLNRAEGK
jgi:predicted site-specific integrase-resolvase